MKRWTVGLMFLTVAALVLSGCATRGPMVEREKDILLKASGKKPAWVDSPQKMFEKGEVMFFRGETLKAYESQISLDAGLALAEENAKLEIVKSIKDLLKAESSGELWGSGRFFERAFAATTGKAFIISGVFIKETYYETMLDPSTNERYYNCYALAQISKKDYKKATIRAIDGLIAEAKAANDKKAEEEAVRVKKELKEEVEEEGL